MKNLLFLLIIPIIIGCSSTDHKDPIITAITEPGIKLTPEQEAKADFIHAESIKVVDSSDLDEGGKKLMKDELKMGILAEGKAHIFRFVGSVPEIQDEAQILGITLISDNNIDAEVEHIKKVQEKFLAPIVSIRFFENDLIKQKAEAAKKVLSEHTGQTLVFASSKVKGFNHCNHSGVYIYYITGVLMIYTDKLSPAASNQQLQKALKDAAWLTRDSHANLNNDYIREIRKLNSAIKQELAKMQENQAIEAAELQVRALREIREELQIRNSLSQD